MRGDCSAFGKVLCSKKLYVFKYLLFPILCVCVVRWCMSYEIQAVFCRMLPQRPFFQRRREKKTDSLLFPHSFSTSAKLNQVCCCLLVSLFDSHSFFPCNFIFKLRDYRLGINLSSTLLYQACFLMLSSDVRFQ